MTASRALGLTLPLAAALLVFPGALAGLAVGVAAVCALAALPRAGWAQAARGSVGWLALAAWLALSAIWTVAPGSQALGHWWHYAAMALVPVAALAVPPPLAERAWLAFVAAGALLAALQLAGAAQWVPPRTLLASMFHYQGNKSIANGALQALAAASAVHLMLQPQAGHARRLALGLAVAVLVAALAWRSASRTSLVLLAGLGLLLCLLHWRRPLVWLLAGAMAAAVLALAASGGGGLQARELAGQLQESNRQRAALIEATWQMVRERPLAGHGIGSWPVLWQQRNRDPELQVMNTAHTEWLQLAQQGGVVAVVLLVAAFAGGARQAWRAGLAGPGGPAAMTLAAWLALGAGNAAVRDAAFAVPMMGLLAIALAQARPFKPADRVRPES